MMKFYFIFIPIILSAVSGIIFVIAKNNDFYPFTPSAELPIPANLETKINSEGAVAVTVTPDLNDEEWDFIVAFNTHSVELADDLVGISILADESGNEYKPVGWEGDPPGGHHREGILKFNPINPAPKSIILKIRQVGGIPERSFLWMTAS